MNIYELYGRLAESNAINMQKADIMVNLIRDISTGKISADDIKIDNNGTKVIKDDATE